MTSEEYVKIRKDNSMPSELLWEYYNYACENPLISTFEHFNNVLHQFQYMMPMDFEKVYQYFDNKFNIIHVIKGDVIINSFPNDT